VYIISYGGEIMAKDNGRLEHIKNLEELQKGKSWQQFRKLAYEYLGLKCGFTTEKIEDYLNIFRITASRF
jgi:hypothetical protein